MSRWARALRTGSTALLLGLLCTAALAAPALSTVQDFAHTHSDGAAHHLHPLHLSLGGTLPPVTFVATNLVQIEDTLPFYTTFYGAAEDFTDSRSRAPPPNV